jgi:DNA ligase 1
MSKRTNRELVMLAETYDAEKHRSAGMYMSEKLDGMRAIWLPHTRGISVADLPFANRGKDNREHIASGLWTRYGKVIHAPANFLKGFPEYPLDGELYLGRQGFQILMSVTKTLKPDENDWKFVRYVVFDAPCYHTIFQDGRINNPQFSTTIKYADCISALKLENFPKRPYNFDANYRLLQRDLVCTDNIRLHDQRLLPFNTAAALKIIQDTLESVTSLNGEGLILRHPASTWEPLRTKYLLKVKQLHDAEATIIGYRMGQGKYLGMLGSLTVNFGGCIFELSGFTDEERSLTDPWHEWGLDHAGDLYIDNPTLLSTTPIVSNVFRIGERITFRFRELSNDGVPKEARYLRKPE